MQYQRCLTGAEADSMSYPNGHKWPLFRKGIACPDERLGKIYGLHTIGES